ncbi:hypothetical protein Q0N25_14340, partial [Staphylococcus aureus]|nr:hypothetical protein [Staphylococcus aureus]
SSVKLWVWMSEGTLIEELDVVVVVVVVVSMMSLVSMLAGQLAAVICTLSFTLLLSFTWSPPLSPRPSPT